MAKLRWGVLGTAKIALQHVVPAMQAGRFCQVEGNMAAIDAIVRSAQKGTWVAL